MARPRTATNILDARGSFKSHADRKRARENEPTVSADFPKRAPKHLDMAARKTWREIVKQVPAGVLTGADAIQVEIVAVLLAEFRFLGAAMQAAKITRLSSEMHKLGLNPSGRASLQVEKPDENEFDDV